MNTLNLHLVSFSLSLKSRYINTQLSLLWRSISRISCPSSSWVIPKKIRIISGFLHKLDWGQKAIFRTYCPPTHHCWTTQSFKIRKKIYYGKSHLSQLECHSIRIVRLSDYIPWHCLMHGQPIHLSHYYRPRRKCECHAQLLPLVSQDTNRSPSQDRM